MNFPYKDEDINRWIYDKIPDTMMPAKPSQIKIGMTILFKAVLPPLTGLFIATKVTLTCFDSAKFAAEQGRVFIKSGVSKE